MTFVSDKGNLIPVRSPVLDDTGKPFAGTVHYAQNNRVVQVEPWSATSQQTKFCWRDPHLVAQLIVPLLLQGNRRYHNDDPDSFAS
jgi:hypothetical protein